MLLAEKVSQFEFASCNSGSTIVNLAQCLRNWSEFEGISSGTLLPTEKIHCSFMHLRSSMILER